MLAGQRVLDCGGELGWLAGRMLADLGADVVKIEPPGADVSSRDWQAGNVNKRLLVLDVAAQPSSFERLVARADVLIETAAAGSAFAQHFDIARMLRTNRALIHVSVTPFGREGPRAQWQASDIELMAAGGAMSLAGEPGETPMRISAPQARAWAGAHAAVGALVALLHRQATGRGQHVDVSAQAAVVVALAHAPTFVDLTGVAPTRCGAFVTGRTLSGARCRAFWRCADGHLNFVLYGGSAGRRSNEQLTAWMREAGVDLGALASVDWSRFDPKLLEQDAIDRLEAPIARFFATLTKREFLDGASEREMLGYPVSTVADIATDPQLAARDFWADVTSPDGTRQRHCGTFSRIDGARPPLRHPAGERVGLSTLLAQWQSSAPHRALDPVEVA